MADKTPREIFEQDIRENMKANPAKVKEINAVYAFVINGDTGGSWVVDLTKEGGEVREGAGDGANVTITCDADTFVKVATGKMPGPQAFMTGKLKIKGDMNLAMKLGKVLGK
jgi:putative sterol carrier protein